MRYEPVHYSIVAMDVAGSGSRDDQLQLQLRADLRRIVADTLASQSLDLRDLHRTDLGDGVRLIVPPAISPRYVLDPFVPHLAEALRMHRKTSASTARLRLRMAIHMGLLHHDEEGWVGQPLVHCARFLDAAPARRVLAAEEAADLVVIVSQALYEAVIQHGYGLDRATCRRVKIRQKETTATAWIHVPGWPTPPGLMPLPIAMIVDRPVPSRSHRRR